MGDMGDDIVLDQDYCERAILVAALKRELSGHHRLVAQWESLKHTNPCDLERHCLRAIERIETALRKVGEI